MVGGGLKKACILYIRYSYSSKLLGTKIFDIRIWSGTQEQIYSIFVFGQVGRNECIRYSYSVSLLVMNIFIFVFGENFIYEYIHIRVTLLMGLRFTSLHPEAKELINLLGCFYLVEFIFMSYLSMLIWGKPYNFSPMLRRCTYYQSVAWITYFPDTFFSGILKMAR